MKADQLYYTCSRVGVLRSPGFQTLAFSPGIDSEERREIEGLLAYELKGSPSNVHAAQEVAEDFPVNFGCAILASGRPIIFRSVYAGKDFAGRAGNYFGHALVFSQNHAPGRPAEFHAWDGWRSEAAELETQIAASRDTSLPHVEFTEESSVAPIPGGEASESSLRMVFCALLQAAADKKRVLLLGDSASLMAHMVAVNRALPEAWAFAWSFSTYPARPESTKFHMSGLGSLPDRRSLPPSLAQKAWTLDLRNASASPALQVPPEDEETIAWLVDRALRRLEASSLDLWAVHFPAPTSASEWSLVRAIARRLEKRADSGQQLVSELSHCESHGTDEVRRAIWTNLDESNGTWIEAMTASDIQRVIGVLARQLHGGRRDIARRMLLHAIKVLLTNALITTPEGPKAWLGPVFEAAGFQSQHLVREIFADQDMTGALHADLSANLDPATREALGELLVYMANVASPASGGHDRSFMVPLLAQVIVGTSGQNPVRAGAWLKTLPPVWRADIVEAACADEIAPDGLASAWQESLGSGAALDLIQLAGSTHFLRSSAGFQKVFARVCRLSFSERQNAAARYRALLASTVKHLPADAASHFRAVAFAEFTRVSKEKPAEVVHACLAHLECEAKSRTLNKRIAAPVVMLLDQTLAQGSVPLDNHAAQWKKHWRRLKKACFDIECRMLPVACGLSSLAQSGASNDAADLEPRWARWLHELEDQPWLKLITPVVPKALGHCSLQGGVFATLNCLAGSSPERLRRVAELAVRKPVRRGWLLRSVGLSRRLLWECLEDQGIPPRNESKALSKAWSSHLAAFDERQRKQVQQAALRSGVDPNVVRSIFRSLPPPPPPRGVLRRLVDAVEQTVPAWFSSVRLHKESKPPHSNGPKQR